MKKLTKTDFILYRECQYNVWVKIHKPDEFSKFEISEFEKSLGKMGNEVEILSRQMFPSGQLIEGRGLEAEELTKKLIAEHAPVIFQAIFTTGKYLAAADIMQWNELAGSYDLYEVKMSSSEDEEEEEDGNPKKVNRKKELQYEYDLSFQSNVIEMCGIPLNKKYLIRLNKQYIKFGKLNLSPNQLFLIEDKTDTINELMQQALSEMEHAYYFLSTTDALTGHCSCYYKGRNSHCTSFSYLNPHVPKYSVHDLNRIGLSKNYLTELLDEGVLTIDQVPEDDRLMPKKARSGELPSKPRKLNQVRVYKTKEPIIDLNAIKGEIDSLKFPLYFLDYETYPVAIPKFDGYRPYQQIVFQYSLHILTEEDARKGSAPQHVDCLIFDGDPAEKIVRSLRAHIGDSGSVISWYKAFENARNRELARLVPEFSEFLHDVIERTYDLMDIVENQYYVHHDFRGSSSIKKVQPVLAPNFSYKSLGVQNGTDAIEAYRQITEGEIVGEKAKEKELQMLEYCKNDTEVMYILWKYFSDLVAKS